MPISRQLGRHGAHERRPQRELRHGASQPDHERRVPCDDPGRRARPTREDGGRADDVARVLGPRRPDARREHAVDCPLECARADPGAVAEAKTLAQREGIRPLVAGDARRRYGDLRREGGASGAQQHGTGRVEQGPCPARVRERRVERVDVLRYRSAIRATPPSAPPIAGPPSPEGADEQVEATTNARSRQWNIVPSFAASGPPLVRSPASAP